MPYPIVWPRSAFSALTAMSGPGCGGTRPCMTDRPASAGIPTRMIDWLDRRAISTITGINRTTPTSKNSGSPTIIAISVMAQGSRRSPAQPRMVRTTWSAPPESASSLPSMVPSPTRMPTLASVLPKPASNCLMTSAAASRVPRPTTSEPRISAMNGWTLAQVMRTTMTAIPISAQRTSRVSCPVQCMVTSPTGRGSPRRSASGNPRWTRSKRPRPAPAPQDRRTGSRASRR